VCSSDLVQTALQKDTNRSLFEPDESGYIKYQYDAIPNIIGILGDRDTSINYMLHHFGEYNEPIK
jgi:hypothetical protein